MRGHLSEGRRWLEAALAKRDDAPPVSARVKALTWASYTAWEQGDYERAVALGEEGLALSRELGDTAGAAAALYNLGMVAMYRVELERASALFEEAVALRRELGDMVGLAFALQTLGLVEVARQDHGRATMLYEESLALARRMENGPAIALTLGLGALAFLGRGDHRRVRELCAEGLELSGRLGYSHAIGHFLHVSAASAAAQGRPVRAARLWGAAESLFEAIGAAFGPVERHHYGPYIDAARESLEEAAWEAAWAEGKAMTTEPAIEYALSEEEHSPTGAPQPVGGQPSVLTRREREVALLVARGLSNRRIAEELTLSEHTAATHVRNILKKLGFDSRTRIVAWIRDRQPLP